jgi:hypothetical protein
LRCSLFPFDEPKNTRVQAETLHKRQLIELILRNGFLRLLDLNESGNAGAASPITGKKEQIWHPRTALTIRTCVTLDRRQEAPLPTYLEQSAQSLRGGNVEMELPKHAGFRFA